MWPFHFPDDDFNPLFFGVLPPVLEIFFGHQKPAVDEGLKFGDDPFSQSPRLRAI